MSSIIKATGQVIIRTPVGPVAIGGALASIPLTPILVGAGIVAGTIVLVVWINNSRKVQIAKIQAGNSSDPIEVPTAKLQMKTGDDRFFIQSKADDFWSAHLNGDGRLVCDRQEVQECETFQIMRAGDGRFALRASSDQFVSTDRTKGGLLVASRDQISDTELFTVEERGDSFTTFKSSEGKYVSRRDDQKMLLKATATSIGNRELFRIMAMKNQITITETIVIQKTISVNIDIRNYNKIAEKKGAAIRIYRWFRPEKFAEKVRETVKKEVSGKLKSEIEQSVNNELSSRLGGEIATSIKDKLAADGVEASVTASVT